MKVLQAIKIVLLLSILVGSFAMEMRQNEYDGVALPANRQRSATPNPCILKICSQPVIFIRLQRWIFIE